MINIKRIYDEPESGNSLAEIARLLKTGGKNITLLYGLKDEINNNAAVLREFILKSA